MTFDVRTHIFTCAYWKRGDFHDTHQILDLARATSSDLYKCTQSDFGVSSVMEMDLFLQLVWMVGRLESAHLWLRLVCKANILRSKLWQDQYRNSPETIYNHIPPSRPNKGRRRTVLEPLSAWRLNIPPAISS